MFFAGHGSSCPFIFCTRMAFELQTFGANLTVIAKNYIASLSLALNLGAVDKL